MKITSFKSIKLNGYLKFNLNFNNDLTFLVGINGSGKTSVLKAMMALLAPDIDWLMNATFESLEIGINLDARIISVHSSSTASSVEIVFVEGRKRVPLKISRKDYYEMRKQSENYFLHAAAIYSSVRVTDSRATLPASATLDAIKALPTPIFLGLDRTTLSVAKEDRPKTYPKKKADCLMLHLDLIWMKASLKRRILQLTQ